MGNISRCHPRRDRSCTHSVILAGMIFASSRRADLSQDMTQRDHTVTQQSLRPSNATAVNTTTAIRRNMKAPRYPSPNNDVRHMLGAGYRRCQQG